jgi:iron complex outermembrane recepter protein
VRQSYSASVDYRRRLFGATSGLVRIDYQHAGPAQLTVRNFGDQIVHLPEHNLVGARVGLDFGRYEAAIVATNLFNDRHVIIPAPFGIFTENLEQRPRTVGLNVSAHF